MRESLLVVEAKNVFGEEPVIDDGLIRLCKPLAEPSQERPARNVGRCGDDGIEKA